MLETDTVPDNVEIRVLGCLIEKEMTTPEYYPMTLNALANACNQKSNRNPPVSFDEPTVTGGIDRLRQRGWAMRIQRVGDRVAKYQHFLRERFKLESKELAVLCELMLRGPQTVGELRNRCERMHSFANLEEVEETLQVLMERDPSMVVRLPREPGRKEHRYAHLLAGEPELGEEEQVVATGSSTSGGQSGNERISKLEEELATLRSEVETLKEEFVRFKSQFE